MLEKLLRMLDRVLSFLESWTLFLAVMAALLALFANVVLRYGFGYSLAWSEELIRLVIIYTTLVGCSAAIKNGSMIKIDALVQLVPGTKKWLSYFSHLVTLLFCVIVVYYGWQIALQQALSGQKTIIMQIPLVYVFALLPLMGGLMFIRTIQVIYFDVTGKDVFGIPDNGQASDDEAA